MTFATPELLWLLLAPVALLGWELTHRRRSAGLTRPKILRAEAGSAGLQLSVLSSPLSTSSSRPRYWLTAGLFLAIVALARPQYGRLEEPVFDQSREILLAIDLSRSMLAPDVKPSRLERAKLLIQSLLEKLEGERVGLVVFAGTAFLQSPLSADYEILREFLPALGPEFLPQGGTHYGALLAAALQAFSATNSADRFLIILSDGEATDEDWKPRIEELKKKNIRVIGLGVGTTGGAMIPDGTDGFVKDERGAVVLSKLESATLQELATATGGTYRDASGWLDLATLVKETVEAGQKGRFVEKNNIRLAERFQWPLALGLWCLLVSFYVEFPVRPRPRDIKLTPAPKPPMPTSNRPPAATVAAFLVLLGLAVDLRHSSFAIIPPGGPAAAPSTSAPAAPPAPSDALSKIIGRLATSESRTARDWAELGRETATWGSQLQSAQQSIPEGPVRDALAAVDLGSKLDPKTADWPKLREELEALLKKSEEQKQEQQKQDDKDKQDQKDQQDKDQKKQDQKRSDKSDQSKDQKDSQQEKSDEQKKQDQQQQEQKDDQKKPGESAFGDMKKNEQPPPPPPPDPGTQKVGGTPEKKENAEPPPSDPSLAIPLQKLEQLRNQDSPAHLFQLMEGEKKPGVKTKGKDW